MERHGSSLSRILWVTIFGIAMGYFEASVVVYLRAIYYPEGFSFPLKPFTDYKIIVELFREFASIIMLISVASIAGRTLMERLAYFMLSFGIWDIFYYIFLKIALDWPESLLTWDILFLLPIPWIGPVIAPVSISILMIITSILIIRLHDMEMEFRVNPVSVALAIIGAGAILYSFMHDTDATFHQKMPRPYMYELLIAGLILFILSFLISYVKSRER